MKTAGKNLNQDRSAGPGAVGQGLRPQPDGFYGAGRGAGRQRAGSAGGNPAVTESVAPTTAPAAAAPESITPVNPAPTIQPPETRGMDLSVWGMYQHADAVVKAVMIGRCWPRS